MQETRNWVQQLIGYEKALKQLSDATHLVKQRCFSSLEKLGYIHTFRFTHQLAWKVLKDYFVYQGNPQVAGLREVTREGFQKGLLPNGEVWMEMIKSRNQTSLTYNQNIANEIVYKIQSEYFDAFDNFGRVFKNLSNKS